VDRNEQEYWLPLSISYTRCNFFISVKFSNVI
jgi:hypothetical protein